MENKAQKRHKLIKANINLYIQDNINLLASTKVSEETLKQDKKILNFHL